MTVGKEQAFTLIELLVVIAIILILIAIALPNFLDAQVRARVSRAQGDMRSLVIGNHAYRLDWKTNPRPEFHSNYEGANGSDFDRAWWGYASHRLTTPTKLMAFMPVDIFPSEKNPILEFGWIGLNPKTNTLENRPYMCVVRANSVHKGGPRNYMHIGQMVAKGFPPEVRTRLLRAEAVYLSGGPDRKIWQLDVLQIYSPTNGTCSFGDIFAYE